MNRISIEHLHVKVDELFQKPFKPGDTTGINEHIEYIHTYIEACGYTTEEYREYLICGNQKVMN